MPLPLLLPLHPTLSQSPLQLFGGQKQQQQQQDADADDAPCFVECVQRVDSIEELQAQLDAAGPDALVVVDFYKTACGACKFIQPGWVRGGGGGPPGVWRALLAGRTWMSCSGGQQPFSDAHNTHNTHRHPTYHTKPPRARFVKLCKAAARSADGDDAPPIVFLKHNVFDDEEEEVGWLVSVVSCRASRRRVRTHTHKASSHSLPLFQ